MKFKKTKIIATLGPASSSKEMIKKLIKSGVDVLRVNFSHANHSEVEKIVDDVNDLRKELGSNVTLLADLQGPKIRIGELENDIELKKNQSLSICSALPKCNGIDKIFISYPSFNHAALEACSQDRIERLSQTIDSLNPFEEKRDFFATSVLSESENLQFDTEGRVSFSNKLLKHANIKSNILFVGQGKTFQIWEPENFEKFKAVARKKAFSSSYLISFGLIIVLEYLVISFVIETIGVS